MAHPIWKDYIISAEGEYAEFSITHQGATIYEGKAFRKPNEQFINIKINDICADYIRSAFPSAFPLAGTYMQPYVYTFTINRTEYDASGEELGDGTIEIEFSPDWSHVYNSNPSELLTAPILRKIPQGAPFVITAIGNVSINGEDYQGDASTRYTHIYITADNKIAVRYARDTEELSYDVVGNCYRYILYYLNAYGGWDFLLIEGKELQSDNYTRHTIGQTYNNDQSRNRGTRNYQNDIVRKWQLHTLWIDDAGAQNMHHLLGSTEVYLYDMQILQLHPITLNNPQCEYKTYSNNGNQLIRYDIEATLAQYLIRR